MKIPKRIIEVTDTEAYFLMVVSYCVEKRKETSTHYYATVLKCSDKNIEKISHNLASKGYIKRKMYYKKNQEGHMAQRVQYDIDVGDYWFFVGDSLLIDELECPKVIGFLLKLRSLAYNNSMIIPLEEHEIIDKLDITSKTFKNKLKQLEKIGCTLVKTSSGYMLHFDDKYFIKIQHNYLGEDKTNDLKELSKQDTKHGKQAK